jgi:hypothetical protein
VVEGEVVAALVLGEEHHAAQRRRTNGSWSLRHERSVRPSLPSGLSCTLSRAPPHGPAIQGGETSSPC